MTNPWRRLQHARALVRCPVKWMLFAGVSGLVLFPKPGLVFRHVQHLRNLDTLPDPDEPALEPLKARFDAFLAERGVETGEPDTLLAEVNAFVRREIAYSWDWDTWGVAEYLPSLAEVIASGREDCDGRAVLAAALLRSKGIAAELVGDTRHMWVRTPVGETMDPLGPPVFEAQAGRVRVRWSGLIDLGPPAFGISVFPLGRELIILLAAWVLLLPPRVDRRSALLSLALLVAGLLIIRMAGADPVRPQTAWILVGLASLAVAVAGLWLIRLRYVRPVLLPVRVPVAEEPA